MSRNDVKRAAWRKVHNPDPQGGPGWLAFGVFILFVIVAWLFFRM